MKRMMVGVMLGVSVLGSPSPTSAQTPVTLSLEDALARSVPASETLELAKAAVLRARGEQHRAKAERYPQLNANISFNRLLESQFANFDFGDFSSDTSSGGGFEDLPFGRPNTYTFGLSFSQTLYAGGRLAGQAQSADAGHRSASLGVTAATAQLMLDVVSAYYDAVLADRQLAIARAVLAQADSTLTRTEQRYGVGAEAEFEVLRARVARNNQRTSVILRDNERDVAHVRLTQMLDLPIDQPLELVTSLGDAVPAGTPTLTEFLETPSDTSAEHRVAVRQAAEAVQVQEGAVRVAKAQRLPALVVTSQYGRLGYPSGVSPFRTDFLSDWNVAVGVQFPLFTGGRLAGERDVAEAGLREAELRFRQAAKLARLDTRTAFSGLTAAEAAWEASEGTVGEAERAYRIAETMFQEGISTQTELLDARVAWQTSQLIRVQAARDLQVARVRVALIQQLPVPGLSGASSGASQPRQASQPQRATPIAATGTGIIP